MKQGANGFAPFFIADNKSTQHKNTNVKLKPTSSKPDKIHSLMFSDKNHTPLYKTKQKAKIASQLSSY
ncbi:MAG: hypothetical protein COA42_11120 [Alteromonadaceae bacterium]|nr:MAG: hypothetical protein COA42_11120 [Alteromonadaceae bacterium]